MSTYFKWYGEEGDEYVGESQVGQIVISDRPHPSAGDDSPYDQPVTGHGDHRYGSVEHRQNDHQQSWHLEQVWVLLIIWRRIIGARDIGGDIADGEIGHEISGDVAGGEIGSEIGGDVYRDRGYGRSRCRGDSGGGSHCTLQRWLRLKRGNIGWATDVSPAIGRGLCGVAVSSW